MTQTVEAPAARLAALLENAPQTGHYLAGLTDGEGCFSIRAYNVHKPTKTYGCAFIIKMRADDRFLLEGLRDALDLGTIATESGRGDSKPRKPTVRWVVGDKVGCLAVVTLFDRFPLWSKKARDFHVWRQAVLYWNYPRALEDGSGRIDWSPMVDYMAELREVRLHPWDRGQLFEVSA